MNLNFWKSFSRRDISGCFRRVWGRPDPDRRPPCFFSTLMRLAQLSYTSPNQCRGRYLQAQMPLSLTYNSTAQQPDTDAPRSKLLRQRCETSLEQKLHSSLAVSWP